MLISANTRLHIAIPRSASRQEEFAAYELKKYLTAICGVEASVSCEGSDADCTIILGAPVRNPLCAEHISQAEFSALCPGPEGMFIKASGDVIIIAGSDDSSHRGTIYAAYEFLERFCGASLAAFSKPGENAGEFVPHFNELDITPAQYIKPACDLPYRGAIVQYSDAAGNSDHALNMPFLDWLCKNRYNNIYTWAHCYEGLKKQGILEEIERRGIDFTVGHHEASKLFLPAHGNDYFPEEYFITHPEFYRLQEDGTRYEDTTHWGQWIFCSRNEEMIATLAENIKSWLRQNPMVKVVNFPPNDGMAPQCVCEACAPYSKVENYMHVINSAAKLVRAEYPDVQIQALAYTDLFDCPDGAELDEAVCIMEATWHETGLRSVGKPDGSCLAGTFFEDNLLKWHACGANVVYYDYYMGVYPARQRYLPMADELQALCRRMVECGISGSATQIECFNHWNHLFNFYCFARTAYDTSISMEDNLARFGAIFGEGAQEICEIIRYAEEVSDGQESIMTAAIRLMKDIDKERVYDLYDRALAKTTDAAARNNIRLMRMVFRYTDLETSLPESPKSDANYKNVYEYTEPTGELGEMLKFDSIWNNNPGHAIAIPGKPISPTAFKESIWYKFD